MPDVALLGILLKRTLDVRLADFVKANAARESETADDVEPRERCYRIEVELRGRLQGVRAVVSEFYGSQGLSVYQLTAPPDAGPAPLARYARAVVDALRTPRPELKLTHPTRHLAFQPNVFADEMGSLVDQHETAIADVARGRVEPAQATVTRNAALAANDSAFVALAGLVEAMARAAGQQDLAHRVRPSAREPGVLLDEPVTPVDGQAEPSDRPPARRGLIHSTPEGGNEDDEER